MSIWNADNGDGTYTNPILYADYSDPDVIRAGEDYFMVASSFCNSPGLPLLHSKDLVNWEIVNYVIKNIPEKRYEKPIHGCGVWAPSIRYHEGLFYVCFPMPDEGIYMCTAKDPYGEWSEPVNIRPGAGWIDPCPFWDDDGKAYLVAGVAKSRIGYKSVLYMQEMRDDGMGLLGEPVKIFDGNLNDQHTIEGPKLYKRNGYYYIFAPAGGVKTGWQTVLRSKYIYGPYEYRVVMRQGETDINGPHQGAWVDTVTGEDWFIHFQDVYAAGRIVHLQPMKWANGWPVIGRCVNSREYGEPVRTYKKPDVADTVCVKTEPCASDDFKGRKLGLQWQWNANLSDKWYGFSKKGLVLNAVFKNSVYGDIPNLLLQKWPAPEFECVTKIDIFGLTGGDETGVISMGMEYGVLSFCKMGSCYRVKTVKGVQKFENNLVSETKEDENIVSELPLDTKEVYVKYLVERIGTRNLSQEERNFPEEKVSLYFGTDGYTYEKAFEMISVPGRWVGVKNGVFCLSEKKDSYGYAIIENVQYLA